ncbi:MAG: Crp/Fnr family transcriptional regulator [Frankia sp.]
MRQGETTPTFALGDVDIKTVRRAQIFRGVDEADAGALLGKFKVVTARPHTEIFRQGDDPGGSLYVVIDGRVALSRSGPGSQTATIAVLGPPDMFGELSVFDPGPRTSTAVALTDARLAELPGEALLSWAETRPVIARRLLQVLGRRLRRTNAVIGDLVFVDVPGRVAKALLDLAERFGVATPQGVRVDHELTQSELAHVVGASRETVNKALADFTVRGWITHATGTVTLLDTARLARRAGL